MNSLRMRAVGTIIVCVCSFIIGGSLVWFFLQSQQPPGDTTQSASKQIRGDGVAYTNPLLECEVDEKLSQQKEFASLEKKLRDIIDAEKQEGDITDAAVYYRDLNNGPWFGIREKVKFAPASLLKLPVLMAYYKAAESDPGILSKQLEYDASVPELTQVFSDAHLEKGKKYSTSDLLARMIQKSDNGALNLLTGSIDGAKIDKVMSDLDIVLPPESSNDENFMSVKDYASLFRVLYNASYLTHDYSEKALSLLAHTDFVKGLVAGVPSNIQVAHKYGEREDAGNIRQLHDCGIVYYPQFPYLLCIMSRGDDPVKQASVIELLSKTIYTEVAHRFK